MELHPGEQIIYEGHPSWRATLWFYIVGLVVAVGAGAIGYAVKNTGIGIAVFGVVMVLVIVIGWLRRITTRYLITNKRMQIKHGLIGRRLQETRVDRVLDVTVNQTALQRMLAIGTVDFDNASAQQGDLFRFTGIHRPDRVVRAIDQVHEAAGAPPAAQGTS